jgi:hypothetical protein
VGLDARDADEHRQPQPTGLNFYTFQKCAGSAKKNKNKNKTKRGIEKMGRKETFREEEKKPNHP